MQPVLRQSNAACARTVQCSLCSDSPMQPVLIGFYAYFNLGGIGASHSHLPLNINPNLTSQHTFIAIPQFI